MEIVWRKSYGIEQIKHLPKGCKVKIRNTASGIKKGVGKMNNDYLLDRNRYGCMRACKDCPFMKKTTYPLPNIMQSSNYNQMWYTPYDNHIEGMAANFWNQMPQTIFWHDNNGVCHTRYEWLQDYLLEYCRKNYPWKLPINLESSSGQVVLASESNSYEKIIKEIFKAAIDIAADVTKDRNPLFSIMLDEVGLVLADDIFEAVRKVISILDKCYNQMNTTWNKSFEINKKLHDAFLQP